MKYNHTKPVLLQINSIVNTGSTGRIVEGIGRAAMDAGWESYIAYGRYGNASQSHVIRIGTRWDSIWHGIQTRLFDRLGLASKQATRKLIKQIQEIQPDIIHLHSITGYYINYPILFTFLAKANIPVVWTLHDCWPITGHCNHFMTVNCNKWLAECNHCIQKKDYPSSYFLDRSTLNQRDKRFYFTSVKNFTIVPVSNWLSNIINQSFLNIYPIHRLYNGINTTIFAPQDQEKVSQLKASLGIKNDQFLILGVANVWITHKGKGLEDFIQLRNQIPEDNCIVLIGLTKKQINNLPPGIIGLPKTESMQQLALFYTAADVFINPSWEDSFPTTNLEALSCGTPIIVYKTGGSVEAVSNDTGFIVEQGDISGIVDAIQTIQKNEKSSYTQNCRQRAINLFRQEDRYAEYIQLYNQLIDVKDEI